MTQGEKWQAKCKEIIAFIESNKRNPPGYDPKERGLYYNWIKHNKKLYNNGELKAERVEKFKRLLELTELYKRKNQYE